MKIKVYRNLASSELFPCTPKDIKSYKFGEIQSLQVSFGLSSKFSFDSRDKYNYANLPVIKGEVIAQANVIGSSRKKSISEDILNDLSDCAIYFYPIKVKEYPDNALTDFKDNILPLIHSWFLKQLDKTDNEILKDSKLIIEWFDQRHIIHQFKPKF